MIDLHIHSLFSDGTDTPENIVKIAKSKRMELIALTDHNTFDGCKEFQEACQKYMQDALLGNEISTDYKGTEVHLLAYYPIDTDFSIPSFDKLRKVNEDFYKNKENQLDKIIENLKEFKDFIKGYKNWNRNHLASYLLDKGIVKTRTEAFDKFLGDNTKYFVENEKVNLIDAIQMVNETNGICVIAHPGEYNLSKDEFEEMLFNVSKDLNTIGIEMFHQENTEQDMKDYFEISKGIQNILHKKVLLTAGSDFHGKNKDIKIGQVCSFKVKDDLEKILKATPDNVLYFLENNNIKYSFHEKVRYIDAINLINKAIKFDVLHTVDDDKHIAVCTSDNRWHKVPIDIAAHMLMKDYDGYITVMNAVKRKEIENDIDER